MKAKKNLIVPYSAIPALVRTDINDRDEKQAWELFVSRPDKFYSFTGCTSFAVMKRLKIVKCLSLDRHFKQEGFEEAV
ncbi:MAG: hypothetical protein AB1805_03160 [Nitrospirota bacterium]